MALNRREVINKWIRLKITEINLKTGVEETHNQLEWVLIYQPQFKSKRTELWLKELKQEDER
jgi:hypothetical protein